MKTIYVANNGIMGKNIHYLRRKKRISREKFAEMMDLNDLTLYCIENGTLYEIPLDSLSKICEFFNIELKTLLGTELTQ